MQRYKYLLQTNYKMNKFLYKEIQQILNKKATYDKQFNQFKVFLSQQQIIEFLSKSKTIEYIYIQIGKEFQLQSINDLKKCLQKQPISAFIDVERQIAPALNNNDLLKIQAKVKNSFTYFPNYLEKELMKYFLLLPIRNRYRSIQSLVNQQIDEPEQEIIRKIQKQIKKEENILKIQKMELKNELQNQEKHQEKELAEQDVFRINFFLNNEKCKLTLPITHDPLYKHGYRQQQSYGSIRESIIGAILIQLDFKRYKEEKVTFYDPFCGSGSILLQLIQHSIQSPIRKDIQDYHIFSNQRLFQINQIQQQIQDMYDIINKENIQIIGSDINPKTVLKCYNNLKILQKDINFQEKLVKNENIIIPPQIQQFTFNDRVKIFHSDFEAGFNLLKNQLKDTVIISNIPYGIQSQKFDKQDILIMYRRFSRVLLKNIDNLKEVYILCNTKKSDQKQKTFIQLSQLIWDLVEDFDNGGVKVGLYKLNIEQTKQIITESNKDFSLIEKGVLMFNEEKVQQQIELYKQKQLSIKEQKELVLAQEKQVYLKKWGQSRFLIKMLKKKYKRQYYKQSKIKQMIHFRRKQHVLKIKKIAFLRVLKERQQLKEAKIESRILKARNRVNQNLVKSAIKDLNEEDKTEMLVKIQNSIDKKKELVEDFHGRHLKKKELAKKNVRYTKKWY